MIRLCYFARENEKFAYRSFLRPPSTAKDTEQMKNQWLAEACW